MSNTPAPRTLTEAVIYFADEDRAHAFVVGLRWPAGIPICPHCGVEDAKHYFLAKRRVYKCRACRKQFSVKVGTIFEDSPLPFSKWLPALWLLVNCKNGVSSYEVSRALKVTQKTAWFMLHRLRLAMQDGGGLLNGTVEVDETFIGGRARFMHKARRERTVKGTGGSAMVSVLGLLQRGAKGKSRVRCKVTKNGMNTQEAHAEVVREVARGSAVNTDAASVFRNLAMDYAHGIVDHGQMEWARGETHTNGIENFWTLVKRTVRGTYVCPAPFHTFRYLDEQAFRFNERSLTDAERFARALGAVGFKRLTYAALTAKAADRRTA